MNPITRDDVFNESSSPIVNCDVLEAAKENVQPLASGRRVTALSSILSTPHVQRESRLSATRRRLRLNLTMALDDPDPDADPLAAYCALVYWTVENYPQGHSVESGLLELLEEATRVLKDDRDGKWRGEMKYLKLWILYASFVERPVVIYKFLVANEIGTEFGLLYEEYAGALERDGRLNEADQVYVLGIARNVTPLERLRNRHRDFQKRIMSSASSPNSTSVASSTPPPTAPPTTSTRRTVLGDTPGPQLPISTPSIISSTPNTRLQIFQDPSPTALVEPTNAFPDLGTRKSRVKENMKDTEKMGGTKIKQAGLKARKAVSASASGIMVYKDPEDGDTMPPPSVPEKELSQTPVRASQIMGTPKFMPFVDEPLTPVSSGANGSGNGVESVMKVKKAALGLSEAEALRKDPLKNYGEDVAE